MIVAQFKAIYIDVPLCLLNSQVNFCSGIEFGAESFTCMLDSITMLLGRAGTGSEKRVRSKVT